MDYQYVGYKEDKKLVWGTVAAASQELAARMLAGQGLDILTLKPGAGVQVNWEAQFPSLFRVKPASVIFFSRQTAMLLESGIDIVTALELMKSQESSRLFKKVLAEIISEIRNGGRLSAAAKKYPDIFPSIYPRLISVGERTGGLEMVLRQIADYMEKEANAKKGVKNAMLYPVMVSVLAVAVVGLLVAFVLPSFTSLYSNMSVELPASTKMMLGAVEALNKYGLHILGGMAFSVSLVFAYFRTEKGKYAWDNISLRMPVVGSINQVSELARFCRSLALLFKAGLPLTEIMTLLIEGSNNRVMKDAMYALEKGMISGEGLSGPMAKKRIFLPMLVQMVRIGEETGSLDTNLLALAENYEIQAQEKTKTLISLIQPITTVVIGGVIAFITLSLVQVMYSMYGKMG